ncbi:glycosyltransferase [Prochlorococcus sp. MIT 1341]|uniref:glycosyltransferase n=1 Tax=Prochlorococcus sp. MIT 1341 TaxID=3096221 RepID=UPI002A75D7E7|nr:glycosyltransferase [Prochlorococcus sp. MIT 1341]
MNKLAILIPTLDVGGAEKVVIKLANGLPDFGWEVDLLCMKGGTLSPLILPYVKVIEFNCNSYRSLLYQYSLYLKKRKPDIVLSTLYMTSIIIILGKIITRQKHVVVLGAHNSFVKKLTTPHNHKDRLILEPMAKFLFPRATCMISVSKGLTKEMYETFKFKSGFIETIYNPVLTSTNIKPIKEDSYHKWLENSNPKGYKTIISVGRLVKQKAYDDLLNAFSIASAQKDLRLVIIGSGPNLSSLKDLAKELCISHLVDFVGYKPNPMDYVCKADLFVCSSLWEGLQNVIIESLASGCPVVSTDCPHGPREILVSKEFGLLAPVSNPPELAISILSALNIYKKDTFQTPSLESHLTKFTTDTVLPRYSGLFYDLLSKEKV